MTVSGPTLRARSISLEPGPTARGWSSRCRRLEGAAGRAGGDVDHLGPRPGGGGQCEGVPEEVVAGAGADGGAEVAVGRAVVEPQPGGAGVVRRSGAGVADVQLEAEG